MLSLTLQLSVASRGSTLSELVLSRMGLLRELIGCCLSVPPLCWTSLGFLRRSGVKVVLHSSMYGTGALQRLLQALHLMNCGMGESLMSPTFEYGGALPI